MLVAWTGFLWQGGESYAGLVKGIHLSNRTSVFRWHPSATNRINTIFMTTYFIGGSTGTFLAGTFWHWMGWQGIVLTGVLLVACSLAITSCCRKAD